MAEDDTSPSATETVYKVIHLVASSPLSWEAAAAAGVAEATKTITDLRVARVVRADATVEEGAVTLYRVKLEASFRLDRMRTSRADHAPVRVRRYLIVANQTLSSAGLTAAIRERHLTGTAEFHVLVPASPAGGSGTSFVGDPFSGYGGVDPDTIDAMRSEAAQAAAERLRSHESQLEQLGANFTSEVGPADPFQAIMQVMSRSSFDEIVISTLPQRLSRWLHVDLPRRVERATHLPVAVFTPQE